MRGRPAKSEIRQNVVDILGYMNHGYGYEIYKVYLEVFPKCTLEVLYYHLRKGVSLGEFEILKIKQEKGRYSWGPVVEKKYYKLGAKAVPRKNQLIKKALAVKKQLSAKK